MGMNRLRRKLAIATWSGPREGNIYGKLTLDAEEALAFLAHVKQTTGKKITVTHLVGKVVADALAASPGLNGRIFLGRFIPHDSVSISYLVALEGGSDLAKAKIDAADAKDILTIADELRAGAVRLREGKDDEFEASKGLIKAMPSWVLKPILRFVGWLTSAAGISVPLAGLTAFPFGSAIVTSVGMFGLDEGYAPPTPFAHVPLYVLVGALRKVPAVVDDAIVARHQLTLTATIDHRFMDGAGGAVLAKTARRLFENPWTLIGLEGRPESDAAENA